jgi:hypothetical protein
MHPDDPDIDSMPDVGQWADGTCPTCGGAVRCRQTNLRAVARTGDETLADREYRHIELPSESRYVALLRQRDELLEACKAAEQNLAHESPDEWWLNALKSVRAAIANAEGTPNEPR